MKVIKFLQTYIISSIIFVSLFSYSNQADAFNITGALNSALDSATGTVGDLTSSGTVGDLTSSATGLLNGTGLENITIPEINMTEIMKQVINAVPLVPVPSFTNLTSSSMLNNALEGAFAKLNLEFGAYYMNKCTDDRVPSLFGSDITGMDASFACQELVYDWGQVYAPYKCNNWFCNLQGTCSSKIDDMGFVVPSCTCNDGYSGQNCMYNQTTYQNAEQWITTVNQWLQNYLDTKTTNRIITKSEDVSNLLDITENILLFSSNANPSDLEKYGNIIGEFGVAIMNSNVTMNSDLENKLFEFVDFIFDNVDSSLQGIDPTQIAGLADEPVKITDKYEMQKIDVPIDVDLNLSPKDFSNKLRLLKDFTNNAKRFLQKIDRKRLLQNLTIKKPAQKKTLNPDSAKAFLPKSLTSALTNSTVTFVIFKDPSAMTQLNSVSISSQVVNLKVTNKATGAIVPYPSNAGTYTVYLPWAQIPLSIPDNKYVDNCKVYSYDGKTWTQTQSCTILTTTNSTATNLECRTFGTLGVSCSGASVPPRRSSGTNFLSMASFIVYAVLGFILF